MRQGEVGGARATAEPERRNAPGATDGEALGRDAEHVRERRDGEPTRRIASCRTLRELRDSRAGAGGITLRPRHRMHVVRTRDQIDLKPALTDGHADPRVTLEPDDEARWGEHGMRVLLPRSLVGALLRSPEDPARPLGLRARPDQRPFRLVEDAAVEARVTSLGAALRVAEVDDVIADHRSASERAWKWLCSSCASVRTTCWERSRARRIPFCSDVGRSAASRTWKRSPRAGRSLTPSWCSPRRYTQRTRHSGRSPITLPTP